MGNVKRSIEIKDLSEDVFSDEIKTAALIEEIEAAEKSARLASIEKQIDASQQGKIQNLGREIARKARQKKHALSEKLAEMRTKTPKDPRVKKHTLKNSVKKLKTGTKKLAASAKSQGGVLKRLAQRINALAPEGIANKTVVEICVAGALIVAGAEIWAWNLTHPLFERKDAEVVVPITGKPAADNLDDDSPMLGESQENKSESTPETTENNTENTGGTSTGNYTVRNTGSVSSTSTTTTNTSKKTTTSTSKTTTSTKNNSVNVDNAWNDSADSNWPTYDDEPAVDEGDAQAGDDAGQDTEEENTDTETSETE